ncbi:MAG: coenzyme F420-0:L-glutamate ligase [Proteobacteria bacterium]|nr:coenzyme F420-0:L-glutamate ligase [Pseudomonadota bacterium]
MQLTPLKTHLIQPGNSLLDIMDTYVPPLNDGSILAITSKIISMCQNRVVQKDTIIHKYALIQQEADAILKTENDNPYDLYLTITNGLLIPSAGIDESNGNNCYVLYPKDLQEATAMLWKHLCHRDNIKNLGLIVTDSHTTPLRRGVTGISLSWCGFKPLYSYIGKPDLFGKNLRVSQINNLDALAAAAVMMMGEGAEQTPLVLIQDAPRIEFVPHPPSLEEIKSVSIPLNEDLYAPLLKSQNWVWRE